ncbi:acyltransferase family protein [Robertmurraya sp. GLU-23]
MSPRYEELDSIRGIAALMVFLSHMLQLIPNFGREIIYSNIGVYFKFLWDGHAAVMMFFVLSGFVLSLPVYNKQKFIYSSYFVKRFCRIYIPYMAILLITIGFKGILDFKIGSVPELVNWAMWDIQTTIINTIEHITFLGEFEATTNMMVIWSLVHEMRISLFFPFVVMLLLKLNWKTSILLGFASTGLSYVLMKQISTEFDTMISTNFFVTLHYLGLFILGSLLAKYRIRLGGISKRCTPLLLIFGFVLLFYPKYILAVPYKIFGEIEFILYNMIKDWLIAIGAVLIILVSLNSVNTSKVLFLRPVKYLGRVSYSLYLIHPVILISLGYSLYELLPVPLILLSGVFLTIVFSWVSYKLIEEPSIRLGKSLTKVNNKNKFKTDIPA